MSWTRQRRARWGEWFCALGLALGVGASGQSNPTAAVQTGAGDFVDITPSTGIQVVHQAHRPTSGSYLSASDPRVHFGVGKYAKADTIEIHRPSGCDQILKDVQADQFLHVGEPAK